MWSAMCLGVLLLLKCINKFERTSFVFSQQRKKHLVISLQNTFHLVIDKDLAYISHSFDSRDILSHSLKTQTL